MTTHVTDGMLCLLHGTKAIAGVVPGTWTIEYKPVHSKDGIVMATMIELSDVRTVTFDPSGFITVKYKSEKIPDVYCVPSEHTNALYSAYVHQREAVIRGEIFSIRLDLALYKLMYP